MKINYDFPWYLQNSEGFMALYTGLYDVATNISPISLLSALDIDHPTTPEQLKLIATLYGLRGDFVAIQDALIYNIKKWSYDGNNLPEEYTELEYIETTGAQYINSGIPLNSQNSKVLMVFDATQSENNLFGARTSTTGRAFTFGVSSSPFKWRIGYGSSTTNFTNYTPGKHTVVFDKNTVSLDYETIATFTQATFTTPQPCAVGGIRSTSGTGTYYSNAKIYKFEIYENDDLVMKLVPAKTDTEVGMYDTIGQQFFTSETETPFVAGPESSYVNTEINYWSGRMTETTDLLVNYIKAKVQIRNKNLTLQTLKQFFEVCLAHRDFNPSTDISVEESTLHFDLTVSVDGDILNDMVTLLSVDPYPFGKPTGISYSINYVQE